MPSTQTLNRIKAIQSRLDLTADGIIGPATLTAIENVIEKVLGPPPKPVKHIMGISRLGLRQIIRFEIGSQARYNKELKSPTWPGASSGVTIGIGYDLGYHTPHQIEKDWKGKIDDVDLEKLKAVSRIKKLDAKKKIPSLKSISIPFDVAQEVFLTSVLSYQAKRTARAYPGVGKLPSDAQTMLLSLVFNRGPALKDDPDDPLKRRKEMRAIKKLVKLGDLPGIAGQIRLMVRLWEGKKLQGLLDRRNKEAELIENARDDQTLEEGEIIWI